MVWSSQVSWKTKSGWRSLKGEPALTKALGQMGLKKLELSNQTWSSGYVDGIRDTELSSLLAQGKGWSSLLLPLNCKWDNEIAIELSKICRLVTLTVEVNESAWGFMIYKSGKCVHNFMRSSSHDLRAPDPQDVDPQDVAKLFSVQPEKISPYLQQLDSGSLDYDGDKKAFPDDAQPLSNHWVRIDFMKRIGITYPDPSLSETRYILIDR